MDVTRVKYFLMFMGYPRSGHTLVASMLNAHPNVVCSNQQFILNGATGLDSILSNIEAGTPSSQWNPNAYIEPCQKNDITVVGDKTGHRTVEHLISNPEALEKFKEVIPWPIKWIHVVRNPFDCLSTWTKKNVENRQKRVPRVTQEMEFNNVFQKFKALNEKILELQKTEDVLSVTHERVIRFIDRSLDEMCTFLDIQKFDDWRARCIKKKWKEPRITRRNIAWNPDMRAKAAKITKQYPWFSGYDFGGG
jgi:hypothetical protein